MSDSLEWLDRYDRVVAAAADHLPEGVLAEIAAIARDQRERRAYAGTALLVGLAGGTGSGKSSLLNALAEQEVSPSGAFRPTTSEPLAWVPASLVSRFEGMFQRFGISEIVVHDRDAPIVLLDLPDVDSVDSAHRRVVAGLLPIIDLLVWVVDPEKYRDRVLHRDHLAPLVRHQQRFRFVLNQIDRVAEGEVPLLIVDLAKALAVDGVRNPVIWAAAADPPSGPPIGIEAIWEGLTAEMGLKAGIDQTVASELRRGLDLLAPHVQPVEFGPRWEQVRQQAGELWVSGRRSESSRALRSFVLELSEEAPEIEPEIDVDALIGSPMGDQSDVDRHLDASLGRYLRNRLRPRATTRALANGLALSLPPALTEEPRT
jgi:50S ribosome-binding GTPase